MAGDRETPQDRAARERARAEAWDEVKHIEELWLPPDARTPAPAMVAATGVQRYHEADDGEPIVLDAAPHPYGRRRGPNEDRSLVAAAARIPLDDRKAIAATRRRRQQWQSEAWDYLDEVPEYGYTVDFVGNLLSKIRLFPATRPDPEQAPIPVTGDGSGVDDTTQKIAVETLERLRSQQGGQSAIIKGLAVNFEVAGECYLHGSTDSETGEEDWNVRSVDELRTLGEEFVLYDQPGVNVYQRIPADDIVVRLWEQHPRYGKVAHAATRRLLSTMENLILCDREMRAGSQNRIASNGFLLVPTELELGGVDHTRDTTAEPQQDGFFGALMEAIVTAIQTPGSASAAAPLGVRGKAEDLKAFRWVTTSRPIDAVLDKRLESLVLRLGRGMNMPVEVTTGLQETTFANAAMVKKSEWDAHGEPRATLLVDAITSGYYQWALEEAGVPREKARDIFVWYDPSAAIAAPDPIDNAEKAHEDGVISDEARRRYQGFNESDAPDDIEILRRMLLKTTRLDPKIEAFLLRLTGLAPDTPDPDPPQAPPQLQPAAEQKALAPGEKPPANMPPGQAPAEEQPAEPVAAAATPRRPGRTRTNIGRRLTAIDQQLRTRLQTAADQAMRRALDRAGSRANSKISRQKDNTALRTAVNGVATREVPARIGRGVLVGMGLSDDDLLADAFDDLSDDFDGMTLAAQRQALAALEDEYGPLDAAQHEELEGRMHQNRSSGWELMAVGLAALAAARLYNPSPTPPSQGEYDASLTVPAGIIRGAMAIAGGASADQINPETGLSLDGPLGGVATGPDVLAAAADAGGVIEGYQWDYGAAPRANPFEPHVDLDGYQFTEFEDDGLANTEGWPYGEFLFPGDHDGCMCDLIPILLPGGETDTGQDVAPPELEPA